MKKMGQLSGGEKVRLSLCKIFQTKPNLLILDEPTNHMDIVGKQALEQMLADFPGTVLFVSHDRYFIKQVATHILDFTKDEVKQYNCTYDEYLIEKEKIAAGLIGNNGVSGNKSNSASNGGNNSAATSNSDSVNGPTLSDVFDKKTYYNRIIQFTSHSTLSNETVPEPTEPEKNTLKLLLKHLVDNNYYTEE